MLVYGEVETQRDAGEMRATLLEQLTEIRTMPPGRCRHEALVTALVAAGQLVGGLLDNAFSARGEDSPDQPGMAALTELARAVDRSWRGEPVPAPGFAFERLDAKGVVRFKPAEGYAFYAIYPETYAEAARRSGLPPDTRVIGIRSIGTSLAPMVSAALGAAPPVTVRPTGHPFNRELRLSRDCADVLLAGDPPAYAIVDEGPGLSGSSFSAVADWLAVHGVERGRIHRFPSHPGEPGAMAGPERLAHWHASPSHQVPFEAILPRLTQWVTELTGPLLAPLADLSGGKWRAYVSPMAAEAPVAGSWERRRYLATTEGGRFLIRFAGLGDDGWRKLDLARKLHAGGFAPEPIGLTHGLLVMRWLDAPGLPDAPPPRETLVEQLAAYLACRATIPAQAGASLSTLANMARFNTAEALGDDAAALLETHLGNPSRLEPLVHRVETDNRLHRWEWLVADGRLLKTDALDHAHTHDFIGPQDIAWDVAGAIVEHDLSEAEAAALQARMAARTGRPVVPELLGFLLPCYLAFQLGAWTMSNGAEAPVASRYAERLATLLRTSPAP